MRCAVAVPHPPHTASRVRRDHPVLPERVAGRHERQDGPLDPGWRPREPEGAVPGGPGAGARADSEVRYTGRVSPTDRASFRRPAGRDADGQEAAPNIQIGGQPVRTPRSAGAPKIRQGESIGGDRFPCSRGARQLCLPRGNRGYWTWNGRSGGRIACWHRARRWFSAACTGRRRLSLTCGAGPERRVD
jgi:hypothetical protein